MNANKKAPPKRDYKIYGVAADKDLNKGGHMSFEFGIVAPEGILETYRDLFESKDIFYTQLLPEENPTHVILEDSNNVYYDAAIWKAMISSLVGHILRQEQENMYFTNLSENRIEIHKQ